MKFEIYRSGLIRREWRWRLKARNGEVIATGEGYKEKRDCLYAVDLVRSGAAGARLVIKVDG